MPRLWLDFSLSALILAAMLPLVVGMAYGADHRRDRRPAICGRQPTLCASEYFDPATGRFREVGR